MMNDTKESVRKMIWELMEEEGISRSNSIGRIPDFHGSGRAADLLQNSIEWNEAVTIFVSPDTAQRKVRENALYDGKLLIMASPKLLKGYIVLELSHGEGCEKEASTIEGLLNTVKSLKYFQKLIWLLRVLLQLINVGGG